MRIMTSLIFFLLLGSVMASAPLIAGQETQGREGPNNEAYVKREVRHELMSVPWYSVFDILQYSVNGDNVTLTGAVVNPTVKSDAENAVKHIEGVGKVDDQIEILPASPMDSQIRLAEYRAIYSQPTLSRYGLGSYQSIHIIVRGGHVTLEGSVDSDSDKNVAAIAAKSVPNVFSVTNNLAVTPEE